MILLLIAVAVVIAFVLAFVVFGLVLKLLWWALIGAAIGGLARLVLPGKQQISIVATIGAGLAGSFLGALLARAFDWGSFVQFILAIAVAAGLIVVLGNSRAARI